MRYPLNTPRFGIYISLKTIKMLLILANIVYIIVGILFLIRLLIQIADVTSSINGRGQEKKSCR